MTHVTALEQFCADLSGTFLRSPTACLCPPKVCSSAEPRLDLPLPAFLSPGHSVRSALADPFCKRHPAPSHSQGRETWSAEGRTTQRVYASAFGWQMVSLANEVQSFHVEKKKEVSSFGKSPAPGGLWREPSLYDLLSYSYCYIGLMTGKPGSVCHHHGCILSCCGICVCMNPNCCLSLSHSWPLAQYCVSPHRLQCYFPLRWFLL